MVLIIKRGGKMKSKPGRIEYKNISFVKLLGLTGIALLILSMLIK